MKKSDQEKQGKAVFSARQIYPTSVGGN